MTPELRLIRYFVAVVETGNVTRAAERLHLSQPSLSVAIRQLEGQLGTALLHRHGRRVTVTAAGERLAQLGRELLAQADAVVAAVLETADAAAGRLRLGASPTARYGVTARLLEACADRLPGVMLYTTEDTTGALLRDIERGALDLAITFCAPPPPRGVALHLVADEPAFVHVPLDHPLASRRSARMTDLAGETVLIAASRDSGGYTDRVLAALEAAGIAPRTRADPHADLGRQAVREGLGIVIYPRDAFPENVRGSAFVPLEPPVPLPFHAAISEAPHSGAADAVLAIAKTLGDQSASSAPLAR